ncbi:MAG: AAA family ATPase, partial [Alphaproteobacteria bacterium]|nr:AAA family ATPase [Alphaproteobacteria bacterium]
MTRPPLPPEDLYRACDPVALGFDTTDALEDLGEVLGQERAVEAVRFGVGMQGDGYNLFALGPNALGKYAIIREFLEGRAAGCAAPDDWCYVHNFGESHRPRVLRLPAGMAVALRADMERLIDETQSGIRAAFESEDYQHRRAAIDEELREKQGGSFEDLQERARGKNVALMRTPMGLAMAPMRDGEVMSPEVFGKLPKEERDRTERVIEELRGELREIMQQMPLLERQRRARVRELDKEVTMFAIGHLFEAAREKYARLEQVAAYLAEVEADLLEHAQELRPA